VQQSQQEPGRQRLIVGVHQSRQELGHQRETRERDTSEKDKDERTVVCVLIAVSVMISMMIVERGACAIISIMLPCSLWMRTLVGRDG
jgi:hypothetical protein